MSSSLFQELKRRNVYKVGVAYLVLTWVVVQVSTAAVPALHLPQWINTAVFLFGVIGFPFALFFAWAFEITPDGVKRESEIAPEDSVVAHTGRKLDFVIIGLLVVALGYFIYESRVASFPLETTIIEETATAVESPPTNNRETLGSSIAVLAFADMSPNKDQEYFSDGISEELLNLLAKLPKLRVAGRTSAFSYKNKDIKIAQIGKELNVAHVLEGSVRKAGKMLRITVQLIDARTDTHIWSETYDRPLDDIFAIQDEIAGKVVAELKLKILDGIPQVQPISPQAHDLYLKARHLANQVSKESTEKAIELYKAVLKIEPNHAPSWTWLASEISNNSAYDTLTFVQRNQEVLAALNNALAADPNYSSVHSMLGNMALRANHLDAAIEHYTRAIELDPKNLDVIRHISTIMLSAIGRDDEAITGLKYVLARDPLNLKVLENLSSTYISSQQWEEAIKTARTVLLLKPDARVAHFNIGTALYKMGDIKSALMEFEQESIPYRLLVGKAVTYYALGRLAEFDSVMVELKAHPISRENPALLAIVYAEIGDIETAFKLIHQGVQQKQNDVIFIFSEPWFFNLHGDPRWNELQVLLGFEKEKLDAIEFTLNLPD